MTGYTEFRMDTHEPVADFDFLVPERIFASVERAYGLPLDGTLSPYASYINRVYGVTTDDGERLVVKFYRPGRWSPEAVREEHDFLADCAEDEIPVVAPLRNREGDTISVLSPGRSDHGRSDPTKPDPSGNDRGVENGGHEPGCLFALFPRRAGRNFDAERDEDWLRLGSLAGRVHCAGRRRGAPHRITLRPELVTAEAVSTLLGSGLVHPDLSDEFASVCSEALTLVTPLFEAAPPYHRIHGDCHRGNILDRPGEGLLLMDFDDMANGPAVQDLWLLLPGYAEDCRRELGLLLEGYEQFLPFDRQAFGLIEPLRFMRMIHFLSWSARQRYDAGFASAFPDWGTRPFWIREVEDLRAQVRRIAEAAESDAWPLP